MVAKLQASHLHASRISFADSDFEQQIEVLAAWCQCHRLACSRNEAVKAVQRQCRLSRTKKIKDSIDCALDHVRVSSVVHMLNKPVAEDHLQEVIDGCQVYKPFN